MTRIGRAEALRRTGLKHAYGYLLFWYHEHYGVCGLRRADPHWAVYTGISWAGHCKRYCYSDPMIAAFVFDAWGSGEVECHL